MTVGRRRPCFTCFSNGDGSERCRVCRRVATARAGLILQQAGCDRRRTRDCVSGATLALAEYTRQLCHLQCAPCRINTRASLAPINETTSIPLVNGGGGGTGRYEGAVRTRCAINDTGSRVYRASSTASFSVAVGYFFAERRGEHIRWNAARSLRTLLVRRLRSSTCACAIARGQAHSVSVRTRAARQFYHSFCTILSNRS